MKISNSSLYYYCSLMDNSPLLKSVTMATGPTHQLQDDLIGRISSDSSDSEDSSSESSSSDSSSEEEEEGEGEEQPIPDPTGSAMKLNLAGHEDSTTFMLDQVRKILTYGLF